MNVLEQLRSAVSELTLSSPSSAEQIHSAEAALGHSIPKSLRQIYMMSNGFRGPTDAQFLWPIDDSRNGLVRMNEFLRGEILPVSLQNWLFFGDGGVGHMWGIEPTHPGRVIEWDAEWGEDYAIVGKDPFDAWARQQRAYDDALRRLDTNNE